MQLQGSFIFTCFAHPRANSPSHAPSSIEFKGSGSQKKAICYFCQKCLKRLHPTDTFTLLNVYIFYSLPVSDVKKYLCALSIE